MIVSWIVFPALFLALTVGCGLLVRELVRIPVPSLLLPAVGLAGLILIGELATISGSFAELYTPLALVAAAVGIVLARPWERVSPPLWGMLAAAGAFAVYAAPIVLSGEATFTGYVKLDDTATWLAITDRIIEHGRDLGGLAPSSYEATLDFNLGSGYPIGAFLPLGLSSEILGTDPAWLFQPYMAVLGAIIAGGLYSIAGGLIDSPWLRAAAAFLAAQPALLFAYYLWGGVKEMASVALLAGLAALLPVAAEGWRSWRAVLPAVLVSAALIAVLSPGGAAIWLLPALGLTLVLALRRETPAQAARAAAWFAGALALVTLPWLISGGIAPRDAGALTDPREVGNLIEPLSVWQAAGIWPVGDFRIDPVDPAATAVLILVVLASAAAGAVVAWRRAAVASGIFCGALVVGTAVLVVVGSPWVDAKGLATASPAVLFAGAAGAAALIDRGARIEGGVALAAIAIGVLWSNALAYDEEWLAPRDRLAELERIGEQIAGQGPALMTEYEPYGVRHFLRDADPEGASELRRRVVPLADGTSLDKGEAADVDRFDLGGLLAYRTLVLRRSPLASRPPLPFELVSEGDYYEVWQAPPVAAPPLLHLGIGEPGPVARPDCAQLRALAATAGSTRLAVSRRPAPTVIRLGELNRPDDWPYGQNDPGIVYPGSSSRATGQVRIPSQGAYGAWIGGSSRGDLSLSIDGRGVGSAEAALDHGSGFVPLGLVDLAPGDHRIALSYDDAGVGPGRGGEAFGLGPLVLSTATGADASVTFTDPARAQELCGEQIDWVEAVG
ncbi:MAG TPA: hypothetical protein VKA89_09880 [Solirubrobacterales bacterium]|nr:hypothetical protein [Solirubrobacterales bacterium]